MEYIFYKKINEEKGEATVIYYETPPIEMGDNFIKVDRVEKPKYKSGKTPILYVNLTNQTYFYEYIDRPLTLKEENEILKERLDLMQQAIDDLAMGGIV